MYILFWVGVIISSSNKSVSEYLFQMVLTTRTGAAVNFYCKFWKRFRFRFWVVIVETGTLKNPHLENTGLRLVFQQIINSAQTGFTKPKYELLEFFWVDMSFNCLITELSCCFSFHFTAKEMNFYWSIAVLLKFELHLRIFPLVRKLYSWRWYLFSG